MRVKVSYSNTGNNNPCVDGTYGEAEDYTVNVLPICTGTPAADIINTVSPVSICSGSTQNIVASDTNNAGGIVYQWQQAPAASGPWSNVSGGIGATTLSYTTAPLSSTTYFRLKDSCTNSLLSNTSNIFTVNIINAPSMSSQPTNAIICAGANSSFSAIATGNGLTYQWQANAGSGFGNISNGGVYSGANTNVLSINSATASMSGYTYRCIITNTCGISDTSNAASLTVYAASQPVIVALGPTTVCNGSDVMLHTNPSPGVSYQWSLNNLNIPGATSDNYSANISGSYKVTASLGSCVFTSTATIVTINIGPAPFTIAADGSTSICLGSSILLTSDAPSGLSYQWYDNNNLIIGAISSSYNAPDSGNFTLVITDGNGCSTTSIPLHLTMDIVSPVIQYYGNMLCTGIYPGYQWYFNGYAIPGETGTCYTPTLNGQYSIWVTDAQGCGGMSNYIDVQGFTAVNTLNSANGFRVYPNPATSVVHIDAIMKLKVSITTCKLSWEHSRDLS